MTTNLARSLSGLPQAVKGPRLGAAGERVEAPYEVAGEAIIYDPAAVSQASVKRAMQFARRSRAIFLPFLVSAAIFTPNAQLVSEAPALPPVVGVRSRGDDWWDDEWDDDDFWTYAPDFVTTAQVRELDELMALPIPPELSIHFDDDLA
jgi:hypothetical protein